MLSNGHARMLRPLAMTSTACLCANAVLIRDTQEDSH